MRKLILLALTIGAVSLLKRRSAQMGVTPLEALASVMASGLNWLRGREQVADVTGGTNLKEDRS